MRILVRRPLIEHVNRPVLKECGEERQALALPLGKRRRRECPPVDLYLVIQLELNQVLTGSRVKVRFLQAEEPIEQVEVGEDHREMTMQPLTVGLADAMSVQPD